MLATKLLTQVALLCLFVTNGTYNKSLDASGGSVFRNMLGAAEGALIRAAASTQPFGALLNMKKKSNESKIITGVAWYRPEQWERLREVAEDVDNLEETYDAWLKTAEQMIRDGIPSDVQVERVDIDVEEVLAWCNVHSLPMNASSRSRFVSERVRQKYESS